MQRDYVVCCLDTTPVANLNSKQHKNSYDAEGGML